MRLEHYNRILAKGSVLHALKCSLLVLLATGLFLVPMGNALTWFVNYAWLEFAIVFGIALILWPRLIVEPALNAWRKSKDRPFATEKKPGKTDYLMVLTIFMALSLPGIGVGQWLWHDTNVTITVGVEDQSKSGLHIPSGYFIDDLAYHYWRGKLGIVPDQVKLFAVVEKMQPLSREEVKRERLLEYTRLSPVANYHDLLQIELIGSFEAYKKMAAQYKSISAQGDVTQRMILLDSLEVKDEYGLDMETTGNYIFGVPLDDESKNVLIICQTTCGMLVNMRPHAMVRVIFHKSRLPQWQMIYQGVKGLIEDFAEESQ